MSCSVSEACQAAGEESDVLACVKTRTGRLQMVVRSNDQAEAQGLSSAHVFARHLDLQFDFTSLGDADSDQMSQNAVHFDAPGMLRFE